MFMHVIGDSRLFLLFKILSSPQGDITMPGHESYGRSKVGTLCKA